MNAHARQSSQFARNARTAPLTGEDLPALVRKVAEELVGLREVVGPPRAQDDVRPGRDPAVLALPRVQVVAGERRRAPHLRVGQIHDDGCKEE